LVLVADGSVRADDRLLSLGSLVLGHDGAGHRKTGDRVLIVELEAELLGVVVDILNAVERKADETLVTASEDLRRGSVGDRSLGGRLRSGHGVFASAGRVVVSTA